MTDPNDPWLPPPAADSRACSAKAVWGWPRGDSGEPDGPAEEPKPAGLWELIRWFWGGS